VAQTIGQHGVAAFTSPVNGDLLNATVVLSNDNTTRSAYVDHDIDSGIHVQSSLLAARPAAGTAGRKWMTTDTGDVNLWFDTGAAWEEIAYVPSVGGNAATATALQTPRNINGVAFDGTANITVTAAAGTVTGATLASNVLASSLTSVGTLSGLTVTAPITGSVTGASGSTTGNAATATALQTARNINGVAFDGTANITLPTAAADASTLTGATLASNVLASSLTSVGTLTSLAVTGDLTVDTSTLKVDSTNNRVGVVNASPAYTLDVGGNANVSTGSTYKVNGVDTLSATTLGSAVAASSLTSVGTLTALTMGGTVSMADNVIGRPRFTDYAETYTTPAISSGTLTLNIENGNVFRVSRNANISTLTISNPSGTGNACSFTLIFDANGTSYTVTYPAAVKWPAGTAPTITTTSGRSDMFVFYTNNAGTTWYAMTVAQNFVTT
jgi:hypothetical protein